MMDRSTLASERLRAWLTDDTPIVQWAAAKSWPSLVIRFQRFCLFCRQFTQILTHAYRANHTRMARQASFAAVCSRPLALAPISLRPSLPLSFMQFVFMHQPFCSLCSVHSQLGVVGGRKICPTLLTLPAF